jgi:dihydroorotase-like cyclic amidohydrolase
MSDTQDLEFDTPLEEEAGTIEVASGKRAVYTEPADVEWTLERGDVVSSAGYSIYARGQRFRGRIRDAFVRGRPVHDGIRFTSHPRRSNSIRSS